MHQGSIRISSVLLYIDYCPGDPFQVFQSCSVPCTEIITGIIVCFAAGGGEERAEEEVGAGVSGASIQTCTQEEETCGDNEAKKEHN